MLKQLLSLLAVTAISLPLFAGVTAIGRTRNGYPLIIPQPKQLKAAEGSFALPSELSVAAPGNFDIAPLAGTYAETVKGGKVVPAGAGKALCRFELATQGVPASVEGYTLAVAPDGITVKARDERGLFYGMQTLKWMLRNGGGKSLKACQITDWPDLEMRGIFFELPKISPKKTDRLCQVIDALAELKYNMILSEFADNFPVPGSPYTGREETFSRADIEKIKAAAKRNHIELVPKLQVASHSLWITRHRDWEKLTEGKVLRPWRSLYCPSNPEAQKVVEELIRDTADVIRPRYFHLGMDEILLCGFPICPKCRAANLTDLMLKHIRPIKKLLNDRGITPIIYQDEFFNTMPRAVPSRAKPMADFPEKLGHDVMINSWEYSDNPSPMIGQAILKRGFKDLIYMSYSIRRDNCWRLPQMAHKLKAKGNILAFWYAAPATLDLPDGCNFVTYSSVIAQGNYAWNAGDIDFNRVPIDSAAVLRELINGTSDYAFRGKAAPVPISGIFNQALGNDSQFPRFNAAIAAEVKRIAAADRAKFDVAVRDGKVLAAVLSGTPDDGCAMKPVTIPIGTRASGAAFLMCASLFNSFSIAKEDAKVPIGRIKIVYNSGSPVTVPLTLRLNINDWNSYIGGNRSRAVLRGNDAEGALFSLYSVEWRNPRPTSVIKEIVYSSDTKSTVASALFAVSLSDAEAAAAGAPAPAPKSFAEPVRKAAAERRPFISLKEGLPARSRPVGTAIRNFRCQVVNDPEKGKVIEFTVPETTKQPARCYIDIPIKSVKDFKFFVFELKASDFSAVSRPDIYWMAPKGGKPIRAVAALNYSTGIGINSGVWNTVCLPRARFNTKEHGGLEIPEATTIRIGFFLRCPIRPLTIRIGGFSLADEPAGGRVNLKLPAL